MPDPAVATDNQAQQGTAPQVDWSTFKPIAAPAPAPVQSGAPRPPSAKPANNAGIDWSTFKPLAPPPPTPAQRAMFAAPAAPVRPNPFNPMQNAPVQAPIQLPTVEQVAKPFAPVNPPEDLTTPANQALARQHAADVAFRAPVLPQPKTIGEEASQITRPHPVEAYTPPAPTVAPLPAAPTPEMREPGRLETVAPKTAAIASDLYHNVVGGQSADQAAAAANPAGRAPENAVEHTKRLAERMFEAPAFTSEDIERHLGNHLDAQQMALGLAAQDKITAGQATPETLQPAEREAWSKLSQQERDGLKLPAAVEGAANFAGGMLSPENVLLLGALPESKAISGLFAAQGLQGTYQQGRQAYEAYQRGDTREAMKLATEASLNAAMAGLAAKHALSRTHAPAPAAEPEEKPVLHTSNDVDELRESAQRQAPAIGDAAKAATEGVEGAKLEAVRSSKDSDRIEDKAERQDVEPNQIADIAAAKITVPDQAAADKVLEQLHEQMPVESVNGSVTGEPGKNGVRQVQAIVDTKAGDGEPVKKAEVLIQTPEMNEATGATHDDYRKSQELRAAGKDDEADALERKIAEEHEAAEQAAQERLNGEPKYKFRSTQANIPEGSEASQALAAMRAKVDPNDLGGTEYGGNGQGLEDKPHVTLRYGLKGDDTEGVRKYLSSLAPFDAKLGKVDSFPPSESSDGLAPLIAHVDAPELHDIEKTIGDHGDFEDRTFPEYKPHATIGYVKPEAAAKYVGDTTPEGKTFRVSSIAITDRHGNQSEVPLRGSPKLAEGKPIEGHDGRATDVLTPTRKMPGSYRLVEAADLKPSHNAQTFDENPDYPKGVQERDYKNSKEAQNRVINQAQNYDPAYTVNTNPDAVNGPPVVTPDGTVLGGNSRAMSLQRVYGGLGSDPAGYKDTLRRDAASYGLKPEQVDAMKEPVLVRQIERPANVEEARRIGSELNKSMTGALGVSEKAVSAGKSVKPETLRRVAEMLQEGDSSLREVLAGKGGPEILRRMAEDGAITERERPQFLETSGDLSEEGKTFVERALLGSVIDDSKLMDAAPKSILAKIERVIGPMANIGSRADEWNLLPALRPALLRAVAEHAKIARNGSTVELTVNQRDMFGPGRNPLVDALVRVLDEKPTAVRSKFDTFARDANQNKEGETRMFGGGEAFDAFNHAFGSNLTAEEFHNGIAELADPRAATAAQPQQKTSAQSHAGIPQHAAGSEAGRAPNPSEETAGAGIRASEAGRAPRPPERAGRSGGTEPARTADVARAPRRAEPTESSFKPGSQSTPVEVRDADGNWQRGTLEYFSEGKNGNPQRGRVQMADGTSERSVKPEDMRAAKATEYRPPSARKAQMKPATDLAEEREVIERARRRLPEMTHEYLSTFQKDGVVTIATDAAKGMFPEFQKDPTRNERLVHVAASTIADAALNTELAKPVRDGKDVVDLVTASPGSGKTATLSTNGAAGRVGLKIENIFTNKEDAGDLVQRILDSGRHPSIEWVYVDDPRKTVQRMAYRAAGHDGVPGIGRTVGIDYMSMAYTEVPRTLVALMDRYGDKIAVRAIDNSGERGTEKAVADPRQLAEKMSNLSREQVYREMADELETLKQKGVFAGEKGQAIYEAAHTHPEASGAEGGAAEPAAFGGPASRGADRGAAPAGEGRPEVPGSVLGAGERGTSEGKPADDAAATPAKGVVEDRGRAEVERGTQNDHDQHAQGTELGGGPVSGRNATAGGGDGNEPLRHPELAREQRDNEARTVARKEQLNAAAKRSLAENVAAHKSTVEEIVPGHKAVVLDPDGEGVWHRVFAKVKATDGRNPLGAGEHWRGMSLDKTGFNTAVAYLKATAQNMKVAGLEDTAGLDRMADLLKQARNEGGGATILRGDYRADTAREEAAHDWQRAHDIEHSPALHSVMDEPEFQAAMNRLAKEGYDDLPPKKLALEVTAKAMAGDPVLALTDGQRERVLRSFLTEAIEDKGPAALKNLPALDPRLESLRKELERGYDHGDEYNQTAEGREAAEVRGAAGADRRAVREEDEGARALPGNRERAGEGGERGVQEERPPSGELKAPKPPQRTGSEEPVFQRAKAPRPIESFALPGMEGDVDAQKESAQQLRLDTERETVEQSLRSTKDVSKAAGDMERNSPLFFGTDASDQGSLFQRVKDEENPVAKSVSELVDDLKALPKGEKGTALDRVSNWTKDAVDESVERSKKSLGGVPSKFEKAFAWAKTVSAALVHDYRHPLEQTDWKTQVGQLQLAQAETALRLQDLAKELKVQAPKAIDRVAMTHYMEAGGDEGKLKQWAKGNKSRAMESALASPERSKYLRDQQAGYDQALKLTPEQKQMAGRLRQHFDDMLELAKKNGLLEYGYRNYVMHLYEKAQAADILHLIDTTELNPDPSFIKRRFYDTFYNAEGGGLTPRSKDIGYLLTAYDKSMNEAIASRNFIRSLLDAKHADGRPLAAIKMRGGWLIAHEGQAPEVLQQRARPKSLEGYRDFDRPQLRNFLFKPTTEDLEGFDPTLFDEDPEKLAFRGDLIIHPKVADRVQDMLTPSWFERNESASQKIGSRLIRGSALAKELMTAVAPFHMVQEGIHATEHLVNPIPFKLPKIDLTDRTQRLLASHGLTLTNYDAEGLFGTKALRGLFEAVPGVNKAMDALHSFSQWQFQDYIPRLKMRMATEAFARNEERYPELTPEQVAELTARQSNAAFGNLNTTFDKLPRTKTFKSLLRLATFAPDFLEARMRFVGQAFSRYGGEQRAALIRGALAMYAIARISNALLNQGDAKWDPEHAFSIVHNGRSFSLRTVQGDILHAVTDPRGFIYNRLNPLTTRPIVEYLSGRDQFGRQKSALSQVKDLGKSTLPFGLQKGLQTPDESWLNSVLTSTGFEARNYRTPTEEAVHKVYLAHIPDQPDDPEKQAETRKLRQMEDKLRSGHMSPKDVWAEVTAGKISAREAARTVERGQRSRLQIEFESLSLRDAMKVYKNATPVEQAELRPEMARKSALIAELPAADREKAAAQVQELLAETSPH